MEIIRHTKDLNVSDDMADFISYINESIESCVICEKIRNRQHILRYSKKRSDIPCYNYYAPGTKLEDMLFYEKEDANSKNFMIY